MEPQKTTPTIALAAGVLLVSYTALILFILPLFSDQEKFWRKQSWIGNKNVFFPRFRAGIASITSTKEATVEGYEKFGKRNKGFMLPQFSNDPYLVLSGQQLHEIFGRPDSDVDPAIPNNEMVNTAYTIGDYGDTTAHTDIIKRQLTRRLPLLTTEVFEELCLAMEKNWNAKTDSWTTVKVHPANMRIVSQAANRVFAGAELCRVDEFIDGSRNYTVAIFTSGSLYKLIPKLLHPIVAPVLNWPIRKYLNLCKKHIKPIIDKRLAKITSSKDDPSYQAPEDALQWLIEQSVERGHDGQTMEVESDRLCRRLLLLNMVAIHTTSMVVTNTILDMYTSPQKNEFVQGLREECERVLREHGGTWTKDAVNQLVRVDSALRESLRLQVLGEINIRRQVVNPNGVKLSDGTHIPRGVCIVAPVYAIHTDDAIYDDAKTWDAFRFSRPREAYLAKVKATGEKASMDKILQQKNQSLTAISEDYLSFGHGRHACPGRFFASQEMKLMLAHIVMTYDIKIDGPRPKNMSINGLAVPKDSVEMQVRLKHNAS